MRERTYHPTRDSVPDKAMILMRQHGRGLRSGEIADGTGYRASNIGNILQPAVTHGAVLKIGSGQGVYWCLPEHAGPQFAPPDGLARTARANQADVGNPASDDQDEDAAPLEIAVWHDGDVIVKGGIEVGWHDGDKGISYNRAQIEQLVRMLTQPTVAVV